MKNVVIIGGGASGMAAAITAARLGHAVVLCERQSRVGRKLLSTGNGRCNLTNAGGLVGHYHGQAPDFAAGALSRFDAGSTLEFFDGLGLLTVTEPSGRVYPLSDHAGSVVDVLRFALAELGVDLRLSTPVEYVEKQGDGFAVGTPGGELKSDAVIVACGGAAGERLGGVMDGYRLLKSLGHRRTGLFPALTQIKTDPAYPRALKGVKADARISVKSGGRVLAESTGEVLFTETGVSGPAAFDVSRTVSTGGTGLSLCLDFLRAYSEEKLLSMLRLRREGLPRQSADTLFTGFVHNRLGKMLCKYAGLPPGRTLYELTDEELTSAARAAKSLCLPVTGVSGFDLAQVTAGGTETAGFDPDTLRSLYVPGLFACGEVLDIDGDCGGFNLQWAWASGRLAGRLGDC